MKNKKVKITLIVALSVILLAFIVGAIILNTDTNLSWRLELLIREILIGEPTYSTDCMTC